jgi:hypothetical protein
LLGITYEISPKVVVVKLEEPLSRIIGFTGQISAQDL